MNYPILGTSPVTEYQLKRFSINNGVDNTEILDMYIKYAIQYNVRVEVAYVISLLYTNFFKNDITDNNIAGIGIQEDGTKMETFLSIEDCIIAQYQIIRKWCEKGYSTNDVKSNLFRRIESGSILDRKELFTAWKLDTLTEYSIYDMNQFTQEILRTRKEDVDWTVGDKYYYYIKIKSNTSKQDIIKLRSELIDKGFDKNQMFITSLNGLYFLEMGRYANHNHTDTLLKKLRLYGYNGELTYRRLI